MNKVILTILLIIAITCGAQNQLNKGIGPKNVPIYVDFINAIPELNIPLELNCGLDKLILTIEQVEKLMPFTPAGFSIIGKFSIKLNYNILIVGEQIEKNYYPYVFVTDKNGMNQSLQKLFKNTCNIDSIVYYKYKISINSENKIIVTESCIEKSSNKVKTETTTIYKINKKGKVIKQ